MGKNQKIDLAIVTNEAFPIGMAATNRIISYAKVMARENIVKVYITKPTENSKIQNNYKAFGIYEGIIYEYTNGTLIWPKEKSKFFKFNLLIKGHLKTIKRIFQQKPKTVIIYTSNFFTRVVLLFLRICLQFRLIIEENEYPKVLNRAKFQIFKKLNLMPYRKCDGMLVMTGELANYYKSIKAKDIHILPMTVDVQRFNNSIKLKNESNYFVYVGGGGGFKRDGVFDIVKGFNYFLKKNKGYKLLIIGPYQFNENNIDKIFKYIENNYLTKKIIFTGSKPTNVIPGYLINAKGIVMAPPKNFVSGGFPTKLGEFLMSGTPVITTLVSDIPIYLNSSNSFPVETNNPLKIANAMEKIIINYDQAQKIGLNGRKLAQNVFNAETYKEKLKSFLKI